LTIFGRKNGQRISCILFDASKTGLGKLLPKIYPKKFAKFYLMIAKLLSPKFSWKFRWRNWSYFVW